MRWVSLAIVLILAATTIGFLAFGITDGQAASKPWRDCQDPKNRLSYADQVTACTEVIRKGRVGGGSVREVYERRAALHMEAKAYAKAMADYDGVLRLAPKNSSAHNSACWVRAVTGLELEVALRFCSEAISLGRPKRNEGATEAPKGQDLVEEEDDYSQALDSRGLVNLKLGRFEDAYKDYDAAVAQRPHFAHYLFGRGVAALRLGYDDASAEDFTAARENDPKIDKTYADYGVTP